MPSLRYMLRTFYNRGKHLLFIHFKLRFLSIIRPYTSKSDGVNLIGFFSYVSGVSEMGRFFANRLRECNIPFVITDIYSPYHNKLDSTYLKDYQPYFSNRSIYSRNIFIINADMITALKDERPELFLKRYNTAVFAWEFDDYFNFPEAFTVIDEVLALTDFIETAIKKTAPSNIKVTKFIIPFNQNWKITTTPFEIRKKLKVNSEDFIFIFNFDFHSVYERKNPAALLKAFDLAFTPQDNVKLILKTIHANEDNDHYKNFIFVINSMALGDKVVLINENLERNELMNIMNASDAYVSLHRSEGQGLGMMEAMSLGKPVIATRYGGNMDFMNDEVSLLVNYTLVSVEKDAGPYKKGWLWAEADVEQAARHMRKLYSNRSYANELGEKGRRYLNDNFNAVTFKKDLDNWFEKSMN